MSIGRDFWFYTTIGAVDGLEAITLHGHNTSITSAATEDLFEGGTVTIPAAAYTHHIVSTDTNDTSAGTGARTVLLKGVNSSGYLAEETVTLNGTTNVTTSTSWKFIYEMRVQTTGSGDVNAGTITAKTTTGATLTCQIDPTEGLSHMAAFMIPDDYTGYIVEIEGDSTGAQTDLDAIFFVEVLFDGTKLKGPPHFVHGGLDLKPRVFDAVPAGAVVKVCGKTSSIGGNEFTCEFELVLVED